MSKRKLFIPNKYLASLLKTNTDAYIVQTLLLEENMLIALDFGSDTKIHLMETLHCTSRQFNDAVAHQIKLKHIGITDETKKSKIKMYYSTTTGAIEVVEIKDEKIRVKKENDDRRNTM